jgi:hypothetical protein
MTRLSATAAAFEGFRVMRREPKSVLVWTALWLAALSVIAFVLASGQKVVVSTPGADRGFSNIVQRFGSFSLVLIALLLIVWLTTTVAAFRAVLRPHERRYFYLRLGADELRLAIMSVVACVLGLLFGGVPAYLLYVLASPIMQAAPAFARDIATAGAVVTVCLDIWLAVRLSLIAVETFAERRFHLTAYWPLTRGRFWYLFACYFIFFVMIVILTIMVFSIFEFLFETALNVGAGDIWRRTSVLGVAGMLAFLAAAFFVVSSTVFCACQAHAFRAILSARIHRPRPTRLVAP